MEDKEKKKARDRRYFFKNKEKIYARRREYQNIWYKTRRLKWLEANGPCGLCGSWENLEVDHINPGEKWTHRIWSYSANRRDVELAKCQVLCKECHSEKTNYDLYTSKKDLKNIPF